jgi:hypothetical protein
MFTKNKKIWALHVLIVVFVVAVVSVVYTRSSATGGSWVDVGSAGFSVGDVGYVSLAFNSDDEPIMAYRDGSKGGKASAMKWDGTTWKNLGAPGFTPSMVGRGTDNNYNLALSVDSKDSPYVAFIDFKNKEKASVMKFNGTKWFNIGKPGFSDNKIEYVSFGIDSKDVLYVAFQDTGSGNNVSVMKYDTKLKSAKWAYVGSRGFSGRGGSSYTSIAFDSKDNPYVGFTDTDGKASVMKFENMVWTHVGTPAFSAGGVWNTKIAIDSKDVPYISFSDELNGDRVTVLKFSGSNWDYVGKPGFSIGSANYTQLAIDDAGNPYVGFMDGRPGVSFKSTVMKWNGSVWENLGVDSFSPQTVWYTALAINSNNEVYMGFKDDATGGKATLMKFEGGGNSCASDILSFSVLGKYGEIDESRKEIAVRVPYGSNIAALSPTLLLSDYASVKPKQNAPVNFTKPQYYVVTAQNKSCKKSYKVTVTVNTWEEVGGVGFTPGSATNISMAISPANIPYVAFTDPTASTAWNKMSVMTYDQSANTWSYLGKAGITPGDANFGSIAVNPKSGTPYVAFSDGSQNVKLSVMFYESNNSGWYNVGTPGISTGTVKAVKMAFDSSGNPYVAFAESVTSTKHKISVIKWDGKNWVNVGGGGYNSSAGDVDIYDLDITFDSNNIPYVAFVDNTQDKVSVIKSNGKSWVKVGSANFTTGTTENVTLAMGPNNTPHVAFKDSNADKKASVMKWNGSTWVNVGSAGFSKTEAYDPSIKFFNKIPYVGFESNWDAGARSTVMKWNGSTWVNVGNTDFSDGQVTNLSLVFNSSGIPYVVYQDMYNKYEASVMRHP